MHYIVDAREAFGAKKTGKGQWTLGFIEALKHKQHAFTLIVTPESIVPNAYVENVKIVQGGTFFHLRVCKYLRTTTATYISPISFIVPAVLRLYAKNPVYTIVHDMIAFRPGVHNRKARYIEKFFLKRALLASTIIGCVSTATKDELVRMYPFIQKKDVRVIYAGPMQPVNTIQTTFGNTLLCAGTLCPRKNQLRLLKAYAGLSEQLQLKYPLILVGGRGWADNEIVELAAFLPNVTWKGYVTDQEYQELLYDSYALVYPSEYEGFGLQVLDALSKGVAVLTSQGGSLEEVASTAALIVDPFSIKSIQAGLELLCTNKAVHSRLRKAGPIQAQTFTWSNTVDTLLQ